MDASSSQFVSSRRMEVVYDPIHQISMWEENFKSNANTLTASTSIIEELDMKFDNQVQAQSEEVSHGIFGTSVKYNQDHNRPVDKTQRRLAQNREAARKSRLRRKAYVQQLESCRLKLMQLEQEVDHAKRQGLYIGDGLGSNNLGFAGSVNSGIAIFKMEYEHWVEEQNRHILEMRTALSSEIGDMQLGNLVQSIMNHYSKLFSMKSAAAKADVFYVMSGMWMTTAERFFLWIGGFRPSELLKVLIPLSGPLTEQQLFDTYGLEKSCQQAEDALSQGMEKLQQMLADSVGRGHLVEGTHIPQMDTAMERLEALVSFVNQADHLRQETLRQMYRILSIHEIGQFLLVLGEYFQRLRALSKLWANRSREALP
ncbi:transcription factor TGA1-like [Vigna umbellata]|uniref:transcription factor TGA1-like n=1 Tax=Vigna umbellata TaxID=87088 RepID=UPI001F5FCC8E|nr:transcription factor TGA1-like [Vigna umbellata]XP_047173878.1 transcription factor TGA1-like [Vigna umbellata]XP_047173879.1 transcription factor TGA1-like [Vigna umbellata]XP_047173880.1 transcription factor TGA1-like [Vigna umbellata]